jgi:hypothetical protein
MIGRFFRGGEHVNMAKMDSGVPLEFILEWPRDGSSDD